MTKVPEIAKAFSAVELLIEKQGSGQEVCLQPRYQICCQPPMAQWPGMYWPFMALLL